MAGRLGLGTVMTGALIFAAIALLTGVYLLIVGRSWPACAMFAMLIIGVAGTGVESLGQPKPLWSEYPAPTEVTVLAYSLDEGRAIYLWVLIPGAPVPLAYALPWSEQKAAQLHTAGEAATAAHTALKGQLSKAKGKPGELGTKDDEKSIFYPAPRAPNPPKQGE